MDGNLDLARLSLFDRVGMQRIYDWYRTLLRANLFYTLLCTLLRSLFVSSISRPKVQQNYLITLWSAAHRCNHPVRIAHRQSHQLAPQRLRGFEIAGFGVKSEQHARPRACKPNRSVSCECDVVAARKLHRVRGREFRLDA